MSNDDLQTLLLEKRRELERAKVVRKRYYTEDATPERLLELESESGNGITIIRDELAGLMEVWSKKGREGERQLYLEGWNGTGSYSSDRKTATSTYVERHCLSLLGGIQPGKLEPYLKGALGQADADDGFLQRLQLLVWPDSLPEWTKTDRYPDTVARKRAYAIYEQLDALTAEDLNLDSQESEIPALRFSAEAQALFDAWYETLEMRLRSGELNHAVSFESHLAKYRSLMPALALLFHLVDVADGKASGPVSLTATELAADWCEYLELHAKKLYAPETQAAELTAHLLADKIEDGAITDEMAVREIYRKGWEDLDDQETVEKGLEVLGAAHWVRIELKTSPKGGRPSRVVRLHPDLRKQ